MNRILSILAFSATVAVAQVAPVQTTLTNQITATAVVVTLGTTTGISAGNLLFVEREAMLVQSISGSVATVIRGSQQTQPVAHIAGATVYAGPFSVFTRIDPTGYCNVPVTAVQINVATGNSSACSSNSWVTTLYGASGGSGGGAVSSVFGRTGAISATTGDYSFSQISGTESASQTAALTGDVTKSAGSAATTVTAIQGKAVSSTAPTDGQILGYSSAAGSYLPLSLAQQLDSRPLLTNAIKPATGVTNIGSNATVTLLSVTGPGTLERIQYASSITSGGSNANSLGSDSILTIVADGVTVLNCSSGIFFNSYGYDGGNSNYQGVTASQFFATKNMGMTYYVDAQYYGAWRAVFVQFSSSLTVTVTNSGTATGQIYTGVYYRLGTPPVGLYNPRYNKMHSLYTAFTSVAATVGTVYTPLPTQTPGYPGLLDSITLFIYAGGSPSGPYWLEGHPTVTVDGSAGPLQYGTEDFFGSNFYFANATHSDEWGSGYIGKNVAGTAYYTGMYRYFRDHPCFFNTSIAFQNENGHAGELPSGGTTYAINYSSLVIWYTTN